MEHAVRARTTATRMMMTPPRSARETSDSNASTPVGEEPLRSVWSFAHAFTIGRSRSSDVVIPTTDKTRTISKAHVRIFPMRDHGSSGSVSTAPPHSLSTRRGTATYDRKATRWMLQDLEAMNGTSLNGFDLPLSGCAELHDGDELVLASMMRHGVRITVHFPYEDSSSIRVKFVEQPATPTPTPERRSSNQLSMNGTVSRLGFETPASHTSTTPRYSISTVATKRERHQRGDASERRYGRHTSNNNNNELMENADEEVVRRKRTRRLEELDDQERCMVCPICFEYFHSSVTLPCSHTFCGFCVSNWFRASLSCPQCRTDVKTLPVRNRALDDLVQRLVGETEAYKTLIVKRMQLQSQGQTSEPQPEPRPQSSASPFRNPFLSDSARTTTPSRTTFSNAVTRTSSSASESLPNVFTRWSPDEIARVRSIVGKQFGETRLQTCRNMGLTEETMARASTSQTAIAMQNLLLDWWPYERVRDEGDHRLKIFLHFG